MYHVLYILRIYKPRPGPGPTRYVGAARPSLSCCIQQQQAAREKEQARSSCNDDGVSIKGSNRVLVCVRAWFRTRAREQTDKTDRQQWLTLLLYVCTAVRRFHHIAIYPPYIHHTLPTSRFQQFSKTEGLERRIRFKNVTGRPSRYSSLRALSVVVIFPITAVSIFFWTPRGRIGRGCCCCWSHRRKVQHTGFLRFVSFRFVFWELAVHA